MKTYEEEKKVIAFLLKRGDYKAASTKANKSLINLRNAYVDADDSERCTIISRMHAIGRLQKTILLKKKINAMRSTIGSWAAAGAISIIFFEYACAFYFKHGITDNCWPGEVFLKLLDILPSTVVDAISDFTVKLSDQLSLGSLMLCGASSVHQMLLLVGLVLSIVAISFSVLKAIWVLVKGGEKEKM